LWLLIAVSMTRSSGDGGPIEEGKRLGSFLEVALFADDGSDKSVVMLE